MAKPLNLGVLLNRAGLASEKFSEIEISDLVYDSRLVKPGSLFFAIKGTQFDGHNHLAQAYERGAVAAIVERPCVSPMPTIITTQMMLSMSQMADMFFGAPSSKIPVIGITGTNGKTTITYIMENILKFQGKTCGVMGTINYRLGNNIHEAQNTTPFSIDVHRFIENAADQHADAVLMEVSSHALESHRVDQVHFQIGVFINLTQDHLDFHKTMDQYFQAKSKLFFRDPLPKAVLNIDDPYGKKLVEKIPEAIKFGQAPEASLRAVNPVSNLQGIEFELSFPSGHSYHVKNKLMGFHNISNCCAAAGALLAYGLSESQIVKGLHETPLVPGRLERIEEGQNFVVVVDYAHTPDALEKALITLRQAGPRKLICVFGCGGDRDKTKRPIMGALAVKLANLVIVTTDNPRTEDPRKILEDIAAGVTQGGKARMLIEEDRKKAIELAMSHAEPNDIILIAGKGHETYQIVGYKKTHFSDQETSREILRK